MSELAKGCAHFLEYRQSQGLQSFNIIYKYLVKPSAEARKLKVRKESVLFAKKERDGHHIYCLEGYISEGDLENGLVVFEFLKLGVEHGTVVLWAEGERIPWLFEVIVCSVAKTNRIRVAVAKSARRRGHGLGCHVWR